MKNVVLASMLILGATACGVEEMEEAEKESAAEAQSELGKGEPGGPTTQTVLRWQCGAFDVALRYSPGGSQIVPIYYNQLVEVLSTDGVWHRVYHYESERTGYALAQYFCPLF